MIDQTGPMMSPELEAQRQRLIQRKEAARLSAEQAERAAVEAAPVDPETVRDMAARSIVSRAVSGMAS